MISTSDARDVVRAVGVRKTYRTGAARPVKALDGIDLAIARGDFVAMTGPSGSGKTSLLNCLSGLDAVDAPDGGEIWLGGESLHTLDDDKRTQFRARHMGFVFQSFNLIPVLTAAENVELPLLLLGARSGAARARALGVLEEVGLAERANHVPSELSGGQQQRVAIARALVHRPAIVWADEPTGNLDSEAANDVLDLLAEHNADGQTIVLVTHDAGAAARTHRVIAMRDGRIGAPVVTASVS